MASLPRKAPPPVREARAAPAIVPLPAPPPERLAAAAPARHAPLRIERDDLMPPKDDPIGRLVAEGHPPMPAPRRFAYAPGIEPAYGHRGAVPAARTPSEPGSSSTPVRRVRADFADYREPIPLRPSLSGDLPQEASALAPLY